VNDIIEHIKKIVAQKLVEKKWSQTTLAEKIGKTKGALSMILSGRRELKLSDFLKIAYALEISPSTLLPESYNNVCDISLREIIIRSVEVECKNYIEKHAESIIKSVINSQKDQSNEM